MKEKELYNNPNEGIVLTKQYYLDKKSLFRKGVTKYLPWTLKLSVQNEKLQKPLIMVIDQEDIGKDSISYVQDKDLHLSLNIKPEDNQHFLECKIFHDTIEVFHTKTIIPEEVISSIINEFETWKTHIAQCEEVGKYVDITGKISVIGFDTDPLDYVFTYLAYQYSTKLSFHQNLPPFLPLFLHSREILIEMVVSTAGASQGITLREGLTLSNYLSTIPLFLFKNNPTVKETKIWTQRHTDIPGHNNFFSVLVCEKTKYGKVLFIDLIDEGSIIARLKPITTNLVWFLDPKPD